MNRTAIVCTTIASIAAVSVAALIALGPLNPPSGAITSTNKTLAEVEPRIAINATNTPGDATALFRITAPGSYYLTGNITGISGKNGITIETSGVTLDLNGFDLVGVAGSLDGVTVPFGNPAGIMVVNGSVRNWGSDGVDLATFSIPNCRVERVRAISNGGSGIKVSTGSTLSQCSAYANAASGIIAGNVCTLSDCSAYANAAHGIVTNSACTLSNCAAYSNTLAGFNLGVTVTVSSCTAQNNSGPGFTTGAGCSVLECTASSNGTSGISVSSGCTVAECTVRNNTADGIICITNCLIRNNLCTSNGVGDGAGIHVTGLGDRIEGNHCTGADRGIDIDNGGNIIIRNTCWGNTTNWAIAANNVFGPIIDRTVPASGAVSGNAATSTLGSTDPNANFTY